MRRPRVQFSVRALMIGVGVAALALAAAMAADAYRRSVRVVFTNKLAVPMRDVTLVYPGGHRKVSTLARGEDAEWRINVPPGTLIEIRYTVKEFDSWWPDRYGRYVNTKHVLRAPAEGQEVRMWPGLSTSDDGL